MSIQVDNDIVAYDADEFPFPSWVQGRIEDAGYDGSDLQLLHERVPLQEVAPLQKKIIEDTGRSDFQEMAHAFVREVLEPILQTELAIQRFKNLRIFLPFRPEMNIHFHNGLWYGHGLGETTVWMPVCETGGTASLQVIGLEDSRRVAAQALEERWSHEKMQETCMSMCEPVALGPGRVLLFQQEGLHGNAPVNDTGKTRVSFDFRVAEKGSKLARKAVGGYFELLDDVPPIASRRSEEKANRSIIGYVNNSTSHTKGIPIHLQRLMMKEYCEAKQLRYTYEQLDIEVFGSLPILRHVLEHDRPGEVVLYSVYALPDCDEDRSDLLDFAIQNGTTLHFANEDIRVSSVQDKEYFERVHSFAVYETLGPLV